MNNKEMPVSDDMIEESNLNQILISLLVIFISLILFILYRRSKHTRRGIILTGLCDSGKTLIFSQLLHSKNISTHTSIKENIEDFTINNKFLQIIDIPGHERLRNKFFDQFKSTARGIVYVIDSSTLQKRVRDVAENLYVILTDPVISSIVPKILILCNKQDDISAKGSSIIKMLLEKEINMLRITKSSQLQSVSGSNDKRSFLGKENKDFDFAQLPQFHVEFAESQAFSQQHATDASSPVDLEALKKWLAKIA